MMSMIRHNFDEACEAQINRQINLELHVSYTYLAMAYYFDRHDQGLPGFAAFFKKKSQEGRELGMRLMDYQNKRGGTILLQEIDKPKRGEWKTALGAVRDAQSIETSMNQSILDLGNIASQNRDHHLADFLENHYLSEQVEAIKELGDLMTRIKRAGEGLGIIMIDKEMEQKAQ